MFRVLEQNIHWCGIGDIYPDGQISDGQTETQMNGWKEPKSLSPTF